MNQGTVSARGLNLRASLKTGTVVKVLRRSSRLEILGEETWYRVRTRDGEEGYVFADFVETDPPEIDGAVAGAGTAPPSAPCRLVPYRNDRFIGRPVVADADFVPCLHRVADFAARSDLKIFVTSSTRDPGAEVQGAVVTPAKRSNHLVGHAIDMNLQHASGSFFNSGALRKLDAQPRFVRRFIDRVRDDPVLRWGGDFRKKDVVHIDDALNIRLPGTWESKLASR